MNPQGTAYIPSLGSSQTNIRDTRLSPLSGPCSGLHPVYSAGAFGRALEGISERHTPLKVPSIKKSKPSQAPSQIEPNASAAETANSDTALNPCPKVHPNANIPPVPIKKAPMICRFASNAASLVCQRHSFFMRAPTNAPTRTPSVLPIPKLNCELVEVIMYIKLEPTG